MNDEGNAAIMFILGVLALRLALTDAHLAYVKSGMKPALILAGLILVGLAAGVLVRWATGRSDDHAGHSPRVAWLLMLPVLGIGLVAPDPLGAFAASRQAAGAPPSPTDSFAPLPAASAGAVDLSFTDFLTRAIYDEDRSLDGVAVRLSGFVTPDPSGSGYFLTRFRLSCCAADARPVRVAVRGVEPRFPAPDTWLAVTGTWRPSGETAETERPSELVASSVVPVAEPAEPYEN